ncbi:unnamed protein product [Leptidea sinapis]|uniref:Major facilitator superfamily (MFS) profile domain-containing protein n=1 Tax=Leptidea sinapis TaxID=189913 RepID=A0A5E4R4E4_9NEOP|nr:unnamed protein product [Leptidea sinapis]
MEVEKDKEVSVDDILQILGPFGKFNMLNHIMILFPVLLAGMYSSVYNFEAMDLKYRCRRFAPFYNNTLNDTCSPNYYDTSTEVPCDSYIYFEEHSIVKEDWKRSLVGTVHNAGFFISIPLSGLLSDRCGRRLAVVFASVACGVFGVLRAFSLNYPMFIVLEFLEPALGGAMELVGPKGRVFISLLFNTMFILGGVSVTTLSWWLQSWRYLLLVIYIPALPVFFYLWSLTESFRWLFSKGQFEEGINVLKKCEKFNKVTVPKDHYDQVEKQAMKKRDAMNYEISVTNQSALKQIFSSALIWKRLFICSFLWSSSTLVYYGLSINAIELSGNRYLNYIVVLLIEAPANVCKYICLDRFGRKKVIASAFVLTGIVLITYGFVPSGNWSEAFYLSGKFFITLAYNSLYIFAAEVFPTNYRTTLLAMCSTIGRIGSVLAPQTPLLVFITLQNRLFFYI